MLNWSRDSYHQLEIEKKMNCKISNKFLNKSNDLADFKCVCDVLQFCIEYAKLLRIKIDLHYVKILYQKFYFFNLIGKMTF